MALWHCVVTSDQCYLLHLSGVLIGDADLCHYVVTHRNKNTNKMNGELKKDSSLTEEKRQGAIERWTDIVRLRVTGENWTLCWMSVITEQILGLAFQEQPIISHYPSLCLSYLRSKAICQSPQLLACLLKMIHLEQHWCIVILLLVFYEWIHRPLEQI